MRQVALLCLLALSGPVSFWVCGLLLCLFVGPTQSASRTLLLRMTGEGKEAVAFGLWHIPDARAAGQSVPGTVVVTGVAGWGPTGCCGWTRPRWRPAS